MYRFKISVKRNKKYDVYKNGKYLISFGVSGWSGGGAIGLSNKNEDGQYNLFAAGAPNASGNTQECRDPRRGRFHNCQKLQQKLLCGDYG